MSQQFPNHTDQLYNNAWNLERRDTAAKRARSSVKHPFRMLQGVTAGVACGMRLYSSPCDWGTPAPCGARPCAGQVCPGHRHAPPGSEDALAQRPHSCVDRRAPTVSSHPAGVLLATGTRRSGPHCDATVRPCAPAGPGCVVCSLHHLALLKQWRTPSGRRPPS